MLKVAIVGCGKIADDHVQAIRRISDCAIVGVCDREPLMASQLGERFGISACFSDIKDLLHSTAPNVVHITTPPQSHFALGMLCLQHGCHVYVEKPFTVDALEAKRLIASAERYGRKITVGNDVQFTHAAMHFRRLVKEGFLGGPPVHMESFYCYEFNSSYAAALLGDGKHWVRQLPGKLLHNIISHGIVRIAEYLNDENPFVIAHGSTSPLIRDFGDDEILDELRVMIGAKSGPTAYFTFSSQMRPSLHQFRLYGPANGLLLDDDEHSVIKLFGTRYKSYAQKFIPPIDGAAQQLANLKRNIKLFARQEFHMKAGLKNLIESFYRAITEEGPPPIPQRQILLTCKIMDDIFAQTNPKCERRPNSSRSSNRDEAEIGADQIFTHERPEIANVIGA